LIRRAQTATIAVLGSRLHAFSEQPAISREESMRSLAKAVALALLAVGLCFAPAIELRALEPTATIERAGADAQKLAAIVDWLKADVEKGRIPGAVVLIARNGQILLHEAVGWADKDKKVPMRRNSIHPIASSSKLITTVAALRLFEANKLQVMAPIAAYLPELKDLKVAVERRDAAGNVTTELVAPARQPTVHDLMTHRAGFTYFFFPPNPLRNRYRELGIDRIENMTADEMLAKLATLPLAFSPGTSFEYSIATDLLGHIIERITKKPLDAALKELVLDPLNMRDTSFVVQGAALERFARPLSNDPDMWVFEWLNVTKPPKRFSGGAGLASTASDYFRVLQMLVNGGTLDGVRLLSPLTVRWALADQIGATPRGAGNPGDGYSWNLVNPVRVTEGGAAFPGSIGDVFWGGITGPRYFFDRTEQLVGIVFAEGPSIRAAYHAELRAMVYGAIVPLEGSKP
jgi:CubicO group peptidase (beta-lactamase class C family)